MYFGYIILYKQNINNEPINEIYIKVQTPLFWICDKVNYLKAYNLLELFVQKRKKRN